MNEFDEQHNRIVEALGGATIPEVNLENLEKYRDFLEVHIEFPCYLTGIEDFDWEEFYVLGPGDEEEYEELKKTRPSYTDIFEFIGFHEMLTETRGIFANVQRKSDGKKFELPLADLKATDKKSQNYQLLHDFSVWLINYYHCQ